MRFSFWPQATHPWDDVLALSKHVERSGWDGIWYADHFMPNTQAATGPCNEVWTTLSALAACVPRLRIGPLVLGNTYRHPAIVAKMAASLDIISGGRFVLGLGAGWQENEHRAYGLEFDTVGGRLRRLDEACDVIRKLLSEDRTHFEGRYYQLSDAPLEPKPKRARLPIMIGGGGEKVTLRIVAKHADEWNVWGNVATLTHKMRILDEHCANVNRDPNDIQRSAAALIYLSDDTSLVKRINSEPQPRASIAGNVAGLQDIVGAYAKAGVNELIVPNFHIDDASETRDLLDRFIEEVVPAFR